jgi:hypothetical protein
MLDIEILCSMLGIEIQNTMHASIHAVHPFIISSVIQTHIRLISLTHSHTHTLSLSLCPPPFLCLSVYFSEDREMFTFSHTYMYTDYIDLGLETAVYP